MRQVLVLHEMGDTGGGVPWAEAFESTGAFSLVVAPDMPGHGGAPEPVSRWYERIDAAPVAARLWVDGVLPTSAGDADPDLVVVGVGCNGWVAQVLALAGRASALVLVDGLGGPFVEPVQSVARRRERLRAFVAAGVAGSEPSPMVRYPPQGHADFELALGAAEAVAVPTLICESPESGIAPAHLEELGIRFGPAVQIRSVGAATPGLVSGAVTRWLDSIE